MKLYTKEMFLQAAEKCEVSMIDANHIINYIDEYVTPIVLPTDEEIEEGLFHHSNEYALGFKDAIHFIKYKIQGASK